jgi:hypothetical protein
MADDLNDLRNLATEAAREAYDPRAARCWPWSHEWTMWKERIRPGYSHISCLARRCVRCGKIKIKRFGIFD